MLKQDLCFDVNGEVYHNLNGHPVQSNRVTLVVADLGWVDLNFDVPLSTQFYCGS